MLETKLWFLGRSLKQTKLWDQNLFADIRIDASKVMGVMFS